MSARTAIEMGATIYGSESPTLVYPPLSINLFALQSLLTLLPLPTRLVDPFLRWSFSLVDSLSLD